MIYLDHHAASPLLDSVESGMNDVRAVAWANPSSPHAAGRASRSLFETARRRVAEVIGAASADMILTSGGTEACNLALRGLIPAGARIVTSAIEHPAIRDTLASIPDLSIQEIPITGAELPSPDAVAALLDPESAGDSWLVLSSVNHETGSILPIHEYAEAVTKAGGRVIVDATQALGKIPVSIAGVHALALASHKIGGPAGAGALYVDREQSLQAQATGGMQERGRRAGTPDVVGVHGFGIACLSVEERVADMTRLADLRDTLEAFLRESGATINGEEHPRVATVVNASIPGWRGDILIAALDVEGLCASSGAACSSGKSEPSPVLTALYPEETWRAESALRLSLGPTTSQSDVNQTIEILHRVLGRKT
jgi:cysteine desulfurase